MIDGMRVRSYACVVAGFIGLQACAWSAAPADASASRWQTVIFNDVSIRVPASWPVIRFGDSAPISGSGRSVRPTVPVQGSYAGGGFDACAAPSARAMTSWLSSSFRAVGIYIGGVNRACAQANLTSSWLTGIVSQGWHY